MTILDISSMNLDSYSSEEIVGYGRAGVLYCCGVDLSELVEKLIQNFDEENSQEFLRGYEAAKDEYNGYCVECGEDM